MTIENTTAQASAAITALIRSIIDRTNRQITDDDEKYFAANPDEERTPSEIFTLSDVMGVFARGVDSRSYISFMSTMDLVHEIHEAITAAVHANTPIDPWPELDRRELKFLIGERANSNACPFELRWAVEPHRLETGEPLSMKEKFIAAHNRTWLEKDIDKRRTKFAKAKALVEAMEGKAA